MSRCAIAVLAAATVACSGKHRIVTPDATVSPAPTVETGKAADGGPGSAAAELQLEEYDRDPHSEMVNLKIVVTPVVKGTVFWGLKNLGPIGPKPVEVDRIRNSGPMDIVVKAEGYMPFHTRLYTDRDDKVAVHLLRPSEAPAMPGYRRDTEKK